MKEEDQRNNTLYAKAKLGSSMHNERNDCVVVAVSIAANQPYDYIHRLFQKYGRKARCGTSDHITRKVLSQLATRRKISKWSVDRPKKPGGGKFTMKTIADQYPRSQRFMAFTCDHAAAVVDSKVEDWTENRNHRVVRVYKINLIKRRK